MIVTQIAEDKIAVPFDHRKQVVEVVGNTARETAYGFHLLCLAKLLFQLPSFGKIFHNHLQVFGFTFFIEPHAAAQTHRELSSIFSFPLHFDSLDASLALDVLHEIKPISVVDVDVRR